MKRLIASLLGALLLALGGVFAWTRWFTPRGAPQVNSPESDTAAGLEPGLAPVQEGRVEAGQPDPTSDSALQTIEDGEWSRKNAEAIAALEAGELERAVELFEACHEARPQEPVFAGNLAEALVRLARALWEAAEVDLSEPIGMLERAVELAPWREDLPALLARWKKTAETEEGFWTDETAHFLLSYDGERRDLLERGYLQLEQMLESAYDEFGIALNHWPVGHAEAKIRVVLYQRDEFETVTGIGHWAGGVYDGVVRIPVVNLDRQRAQIERVLRHELVHAFVRSMGGKQVPAWLNEGLAQWHEGNDLADRAASVEQARLKLSGVALFPLEKLRGSLASWKDETAINRGYAQSLALVDYLSRTYGEFLLYEMLSGRLAGKTCAETFKSRAGVELEGALEDLAREL